MFWSFIVLALFWLGIADSKVEFSYSCDSKVYCQGKLLHTVQTSNLFSDSKHFVDMPMKYSEEKTLTDFDRLWNETGGDIPFDKLKKFVADYFEEPENELLPYDPPDWTGSPSILDNISDPQLRKFASSLNHIWKELSREMNYDVAEKANQTSLIYVPKPFVIPGDRFREFYYWDSYWIVNGLLTCDMKDTVKGMLENLISMVDRFGMVPNGGRIYYTKRTQPPLLIPMFESYFYATQDMEFLRNNIEMLEQEYEFWVNNRQVNVSYDGRDLQLFSYNAGSDFYRPEGYKEDLALTKDMTEEDRQRTLHHVTSTCESGWDFSSRWFIDNQNLATVQTADVVPVDLNAFICGNERILAGLYHILQNEDKASYYEDRYRLRRDAVFDLLWDSNSGVWFDYIVPNKTRNNKFFSSNLVPLFTGCYDELRTEEIVQKVLNYLHDSKALDFPGGVPTSLNEHVTQQWDFPNAWPPNMHMIIEGLASTGHIEAQKMAYDLASNWVKSNWKSYQDYGYMYEKFDVREYGKPGGGGEYTSQKGFGWTNGVVLMLLDRYGDVLALTESPPPLTRTQLGLVSGIGGAVIGAVVMVIVWLIHRCRKNGSVGDGSKYAMS